MAAEHYDLSGHVTLGVADGVDDATQRYVAGQMDPFVARDGATSPDVLIDSGPEPNITEVTNPATDGLVTGSDGSGLYVRGPGGWCRLPDLAGEGPARFVLSGDFALWRVFRTAVRPALQIGLLRHDTVAVHSASVELDGGAIVVAGWSESGKTETALALMERGACFLSDKWTLWGADGTLSMFPITIGIRRWVLPHLPQLRASLTRRARAQFVAAGVADRVSGPLRGRRRGGRLTGLAGEAMGRAVALADRAALTPTELRAAYGQSDDVGRRVPVRCIVLLANSLSEAVTVDDADPRQASARLARTAAYERRVWFALQERARYSLPMKPPGRSMEQVIERERSLLEPRLAETRVLTVRAPFPTDPGRLADAILARL